MKELLLLAHPVFAVVVMGLVLWIAAGVYYGAIERKTLHKLALAAAFFTVLTAIFGGWWYVVYYGEDKHLIVKSSWAFAHKFFMETKEHIFFDILILSLYLPIATAKENIQEKPAKRLILTVSAMILFLMLLLEGEGAIVAQGAKAALQGGV